MGNCDSCANDFVCYPDPNDGTLRGGEIIETISRNRVKAIRTEPPYEVVQLEISEIVGSDLPDVVVRNRAQWYGEVVL